MSSRVHGSVIPIPLRCLNRIHHIAWLMLVFRRLVNIPLRLNFGRPISVLLLHIINSSRLTSLFKRYTKTIIVVFEHQYALSLAILIDNSDTMMYTVIVITIEYIELLPSSWMAVARSCCKAIFPWAGLWHHQFDIVSLLMISHISPVMFNHSLVVHDPFVHGTSLQNSQTGLLKEIKKSTGSLYLFIRNSCWSSALVH